MRGAVHANQQCGMHSILHAAQVILQLQHDDSVVRTTGLRDKKRQHSTAQHSIVQHSATQNKKGNSS